MCKTHQSKLKAALSADHNHATEQKRGLLCHKCNRALGLLSESAEVVLSALCYLQKWDEL